MSLLKSAINQVGRDVGKVVSNTVLKDAHSTPYRRVGNNQSTSQRRVSNFKSEFDKAIDFQTGFKPNTLITKISGVYTVLKNEANAYISDGYLDDEEFDNLFMMIQRFNDKIDDIVDILEIDEEKNEREISQLTKIIQKTNDLIANTLKASAEGCQNKKQEHLLEADLVEIKPFGKYLLLCFLWMKNYAQTGIKSMGKTIFANIASVLFSFMPYFFSLLNGLFTYSGYKKKRKELISLYKKAGELEGKKGEELLKMIPSPIIEE